MDNDMIMVYSASNSNVVINAPEIPLRKTWKKKGARFPVDRKALMQAYYGLGVETLFKEGLLYTDDKTFLKDVGLMEENGTNNVVLLTDALLVRIIKTMPVQEVKAELKKLSPLQLDEVASYAIEHYKELQMDRVDILSKATGKNIMAAIRHYQSGMEE